MFIDTSAIVALLVGEAEAEAIAQTLAQASRRTTSPLVRLEAAAVVATGLDISPSQAEKLFDQLIAEAEIAVEPITDSIGKAAVRCFEVYGKGRHPARLNIVDCFS